MNDIFNESVMEYDEFFTWLLGEKLAESNVSLIGVDEVVPHVKGERSCVAGSTLDNFIRSTNVKYYGKESNILKGDFVELKMKAVMDKQSFVRLSVQNLYDAYRDGGTERVSAIITDNCSYAVGIEARATRVIEDMQVYADIKDKLIIRPVNFTLNEGSLSGMTYKRIGDIALVLYAIVFDDVKNGCLNTVNIPYEMVKNWEVTEEMVYEEAMKNTNSYAVPQLFPNILDTENYCSFMAETYAGTLDEQTIPLVTTSRKTNGAIVIFYDGVCKKIAEMFGGSFYVAFTSIHEAMLHKEGTVEPSSIRRHIRATNAAFGPDDTLTEEVWYYNAETDSFDMVI